MHLWGVGAFDNSAAIELLAELDEGGIEALDARLRTARDDERVEEDDACVLAAAELLAREEVDAGDGTRLLVASDAVGRVVRASALREAMREAGLLDAWAASAGDLIRRLSLLRDRPRETPGTRPRPDQHERRSQ